MMKQVRMEYCCYKKIIVLILISFVLQILRPMSSLASYIVWPSELNLYDDSIVFDEIISTTSTASDTKKGFLFTGDPRDIFYLGAGHIAINVTLSGRGHAVFQYLEGLKKRGVKITLILINDKPPVGVNPKEAPAEYQNPYCYLIDFSANNGEWQKYNFDRIVDDYAKYVDNWIIGNEINSQLYSFYGPATLEEYTEKYCDTFLEIYNKVKERNENADLYISFEQTWDIPALDPKNKLYNAELGRFRYNAVDQLEFINKYLNKKVDWGIALHPYPTPIDSGNFWGGDYTGFDMKDPIEENRPYLTTIKNFEVALQHLSEKRFLRTDNSVRNIIISEIGISSHDGEEKQAAGLYYLWEKIKDNNLIKFFLYNAQTDVPDGLNCGLVSDKKRKRLSWTVFRDMDKEEQGAWCKDLLDRVLEENGYVDVSGILVQIATESEVAENAVTVKKSNVIIQPK